MILRKGEFRGEKVLYPDGIGCCIWIPVEPEDDSWGLAWDFAFEDIDDLIALLQEMKTAEYRVFEDDEEREQAAETDSGYTAEGTGALDGDALDKSGFEGSTAAAP